jgi:hypothetical protein
MINNIRKELKKHLQLKDEAKYKVQSLTDIYMNELGDNDFGIYITDHAIIRYLERVKGVFVPAELNNTSDIVKLKSLNIEPAEVREEMLTIKEDRSILLKQISRYNRGQYSYIIKELAVVTVIIN